MAASDVYDLTPAGRIEMFRNLCSALVEKAEHRTAIEGLVELDDEGMVLGEMSEMFSTVNDAYENGDFDDNDTDEDDTDEDSDDVDDDGDEQPASA